MRFGFRSVVGRLVAGGILAALALSCDTARADADTSRATIERRAREVLESGPYQTELVEREERRERGEGRSGGGSVDPGRDPDGIPVGERRSRRGVDAQTSGGGTGLNLAWLSGLGPVIVVVACAAVAMFVGYLLMNLPRRGGRAKAVVASPADAEARSGEVVAVPLDDPDRLAAAGRFDLAIHAALLCAIDRIANRVDCGAARTTREILADRELDSRVRDPFGRLALECERTLFGGCPADAHGYERARSALDAIPVGAASDGPFENAGQVEDAASRGGRMS